jgi:hypothetical protein
MSSMCPCNAIHGRTSVRLIEADDVAVLQNLENIDWIAKIKGRAELKCRHVTIFSQGV